ncbi:cupin 2 domain-containing protein [Mariprofundus micogutta]|uniref:Cupin 2 domain-containing protein n=1 Tax=Mariprofundus micogutta TaxID=1921010 RepID=A0A1L8CMG8_9PROT|nr:cupin domain-containing protein [Mariprofundus micogutta]GAV20039.1 cupin 2 domain-containing protein [Mariprofundus micogutta]
MNIPDAKPHEVIETLLHQKHLRIERIISAGQSTAEGQWYDQQQDEWIIVLQGQARLQLEQMDKEITLNSGDYLLIPAHCRHRVSWTDPEQNTLWLALFFTP